MAQLSAEDAGLFCVFLEWLFYRLIDSGVVESAVIQWGERAGEFGRRPFQESAFYRRDEKLS